MKTVVDVDKLRIGMYVCELDRPWRETPFLFQGFEIQDQEQIDTLRRYCRTVSILRHEPVQITPVSRKPLPRTTTTAWAAPQPSLRIEQEIYKINNRPHTQAAYADITSLPEEVERVRDIFIEARLLIQEVMHDAKLGRSLKLSGAKQAVSRMTESVLRNPDALMCFAQLKRKDEYVAMHGLRSCILALAFGRHLGMPREQLEVLGIGALLSDFGMVKVPEEVLAKDTALTPAETELVKQHVVWGAQLLTDSHQIPTSALQVVTEHHERHDGSGYLKGLRGGEISTLGMIGAIVDHYDAITSDRMYRGALPAHSVLMKMYEWRNTLFSAELVEKFIQCLGVYPIGSVVELNTGEIGVVAAANRQQRLKPHVMLVYRADRTPYDQMPITNIATRRTTDDRPCEIERVLDPSAINVDPAHYLRTAVAL
jgi:HD-GYP domain-containing protein (c-di-GMP phosphodiesterase class II)